MSQPKRYHLYAGLDVHAFAKAEAVLKFSVEDDGMWVKWEDYARLKAEVERLTNNCDYLDRKLDEELDKSAMLCGQVERLTKAGDAMAYNAHKLGVDAWLTMAKSVVEWENPKEVLK